MKTQAEVIKGAVSHHEAELAELRADPELVVAAIASLDEPQNREAGLLALDTIARAFKGNVCVTICR